MKKPKLYAFLVVVSAFFALEAAGAQRELQPQQAEAAAQGQTAQTEAEAVSEAASEADAAPEYEIKIDYEMTFGRIVRVENGAAIVNIVSKIAPAEIQPTFFACDVKSNPVAELESMSQGYKNCFLFRIVRGEAREGDTVVVRYYKKEYPPAKDERGFWRRCLDFFVF